MVKHPHKPTAPPSSTAAAPPSAEALFASGSEGLVEAQGPTRKRATFAPGEELASRFRIERFIAQGGAGEVYEAEDLELRVTVALKVVRPEIADNEQAIERFRREIQLARQVTHPNVCRIFDVFRHEIPDSREGRPPRKFLFLTMELLKGESLASRLHRLGPIPTGQAIDIVEGMTQGLTAAHRAGVIHRDFKSANVVLVPQNGGYRVVITDFGLARGEVESEAFPATITQSGTVVGTPTYMAPEQLTGDRITPAVDTYALGIVMYEMVTGARPFKGETDLSTAVKRLTEAPASPRVHVPDLDPRWERSILRCLERAPEDRFAKLDELVRSLRGEPTAGVAPSASRRPGPVGAVGQDSPVGAVGQDSPVGAVGQDSPVGAVGQDSPVGAVGQHSPVGAVGQHSPVGAVGQHSPVGAPGQHSPVGAPGQHSPVGAPGQHSPVGAPGQHSPAGAPGQHSPAGAPGGPGPIVPPVRAPGESTPGAPSSQLQAPTETGALAASGRRRYPRLRLAMLVGLLATAVAAGFALSNVTNSRATPAPEVELAASRSGRPAIAVLEFKNLAGDARDDWMSGALQEMVNMELAAGGHLLPLPSESVNQAARELRVEGTGGLSTETVFRLRQLLGAHMVVDGSYLTSGGQLRLHLRLHGQGQIPVLLTLPGRQDQLFDLVAQAGTVLREKLGLVEYLGRRESLAAKPQAVRLYEQGIEAMRRLDAPQARDLFEQAIEADPIHAEAHVGLASAWAFLGYAERASRSCERAVDLAAPLSREQRLAIEADHKILVADWERAAELYRSLFGFFPDNLDYGLGLARAEAGAGRGEAALVTVEALRSLEPGAADGRIDLVEAWAAERLGEHERQLQAARNALARGEGAGAELLMAESRLFEGRALAELNSLVEAQNAATAAQRAFSEAEVPRGLAESLRLLASVRERRGDSSGAERLRQRATAIEEELREEG